MKLNLIQVVYIVALLIHDHGSMSKCSWIDLANEINQFEIM